MTLNAPTLPAYAQGALPSSVTVTAPSAAQLLQGQVQPGITYNAQPQPGMTYNAPPQPGMTYGAQPQPGLPAAPMGPGPTMSISQPSVAGALEPEPLSLVSTGVGQSAGVLQPLPGRGRIDGAAAIAANPNLGWRRIGDIAGHFGTSYHQFVLENNQLPPAEAVADPDVTIGKSLGTTLSRVLQSRDLARARHEVEDVRLTAPSSSRFKSHLAALDETLRAMGH
jgi:hypothetical protein